MHPPLPITWACRRRALLEASAKWVRQDELLDRINAALDNPAPFGFVTTQPRNKGQ